MRVVLLYGNDLDSIKLIVCSTIEIYEEHLKLVQRLIHLNPHGVYLKDTSEKVKRNGQLFLPSGEIEPLYTGGYIQEPMDIFHWSLQISCGAVSPHDFDMVAI